MLLDFSRSHFWQASKNPILDHQKKEIPALEAGIFHIDSRIGADSHRLC